MWSEVGTYYIHRKPLFVFQRLGAHLQPVFEGFYRTWLGLSTPWRDGGTSSGYPEALGTLYRTETTKRRDGGETKSLREQRDIL